MGAGEKIEFDGLDETATATFATLYFKGLPVLASPILSFPTSDRRKSGFLTPSFGLSSTSGTDIHTPYYFNLAPNYDYTLTPRVMTRRGVLLDNELRYLSPTQRATLVYDVIAKDREFGESRNFTAVRYEFASPTGFAAGINYNRHRTIDTLSTSAQRLSTHRRRSCQRTAILHTTMRIGIPPCA